MKEKPTTEQIQALLSPCLKVLPEGFAIDLAHDLAAWDTLVKACGGPSLCRACAAVLAAAYRDAYGEPFLFTERCMAFELWWHLLTYRYTQGLSRLRPLGSLPFSRKKLDRSCHSVEIDTNDVYRWSQRLVFRYFFGIAPVYRKTARDPYALPFRGRFVRVPFSEKRSPR